MQCVELGQWAGEGGCLRGFHCRRLQAISRGPALVKRNLRLIGCSFVPLHFDLLLAALALHAVRPASGRLVDGGRPVGLPGT